MSFEIKLRCANITTIYVSRTQNQTVSDVILQVCTCNQNLGSTNSFKGGLPSIFARNKDFSENDLFYKENYPQFKINLWFEKVNFLLFDKPWFKNKKGSKIDINN